MKLCSARYPTLDITEDQLLQPACHSLVAPLQRRRLRPQFHNPASNDQILYLAINVQLNANPWRGIIPSAPSLQDPILKHPATVLFSIFRPFERRAEEIRLRIAFHVMAYSSAARPVFMHRYGTSERVLLPAGQFELLIVSFDLDNFVQHVICIEMALQA